MLQGPITQMQHFQHVVGQLSFENIPANGRKAGNNLLP